MTRRGVSALIATVALSGLVFLGIVWAGSRPEPVHTQDDPWAHVPVRPAPVSHAAFFEGEFPDGPSVTRACLRCHPAAAEEVMKTSHWTWAGEDAVSPLTHEPLAIGKKNLQNNFCIAIAGNWPRCTSCHVGYGWTDDSFFDAAGPEQVDCLICHDQSGTYQKEPTGAGLPAKGVDLKVAAQSVGRTNRANCGTCHFKGGGGDGVKHGDLDETMYFPPARIDVHMGVSNLVCADCHKTEKHQVKGRLLPPSMDEDTRVNCTDCHSDAPHREERINGHVKTLACQTCHIPTFALETGTKMWWDWSKGGIDGDPHEIAHRLVEEIQHDPELAKTYPPTVRALFEQVGTNNDVWAHYNKKKGLFLIARLQKPEYRWYDRRTQRYLPGEKVEGEGPVAINRPLGDARDPDSKIWPFKVHRGRQPIDLVHGYLLYPHVFGKGGYWKEFDWDLALETGAEASGIPFSGEYGWIDTEMFWPQNHMVQAKEKALRCADCHGPGGRMDWEALGYPSDPSLTGDRRQLDIVREKKSVYAEGDGEAR